MLIKLCRFFIFISLRISSLKILILYFDIQICFLQIEDLQNQIKEAERKVDEKRSILETSQVLECEQDEPRKSLL